jgi:hypothetical protein
LRAREVGLALTSVGASHAAGTAATPAQQ